MPNNGVMSKTRAAKDSFADVHGVPMFSGGRPHDHYLGRVVIELWDVTNGGRQGEPQALVDAAGLCIVTEATAEGLVSNDELLERVGACLPFSLSAKVNN